MTLVLPTRLLPVLSRRLALLLSFAVLLVMNLIPASVALQQDFYRPRRRWRTSQRDSLTFASNAANGAINGATDAATDASQSTEWASVSASSSASSSARAGSDGYSVSRQPAQWVHDTADPIFAIPESRFDNDDDAGFDSDTTRSLSSLSSSSSSLDENWWRSSKAKNRRDTVLPVAVAAADGTSQSQSRQKQQQQQQTQYTADVTDEHSSFNLAQRTLDTLDVPRLWQALLVECTTVPAKRLVQRALGGADATTLTTTATTSTTTTTTLAATATNKSSQSHATATRKAFQPLIADTVEGCQERYRAVQEMEWILDQTDSASSVWDEDDLLVTYRTTVSRTTGTTPSSSTRTNPRGSSSRQGSSSPSSPPPLYLIGRPPPLAGDALAWERIVQVAVTEARVLDGLDISNVATMLDTMTAVQSWNQALLVQCQERNERRRTTMNEEEDEAASNIDSLENIHFVEIPAIVACVRVNTTLQDLLHTALDQSDVTPKRGASVSQVDALGRLSGITFPTIGQLRSQIRSLKQDIMLTLESLVATPTMQSKLSLESGGPVVSELASSGRLVVPVDRQYSSSALGIVHDTSRSGKTLYIEPHEIIGPTNALKQAESALRTEEGRVWRLLTEQILRNRMDIEMSVAALGQLDLILARIRLGRHILGGVIPMVRDEGVIELRNAKHPILLLRRQAALEESTGRMSSSASTKTAALIGADVMGNTVTLGAGQNQGLVLTGPNAGGKTVILKLLGLMALMARSGIPVPADKTATHIGNDDLSELLGRNGNDDTTSSSYQPRVDFFNPVLADIGDLQSVGGDLSTFSGHMLVCREVLNSAGRNALVLMDELGSGTDPNQGVAIAQALLEAVLASGARVAITTHYLQLKQLAATDERFSVAGMQFINGRPTYKLLPGTVGESYALAVAERLGLPPAVLARANELLDSETRQMGDLIRDMEDQKALVDQQVAALAQKQKDMEALELKIKGEATRLENKQLDARRIEARKFAKILEEKEALLEDILEKLKSDPSRRVVAKSWDDIKFVKRDALNEAENVPSVVARKKQAAADMEEAAVDLVPIAEMREKPVLREGDVVIICDHGPMLGREATVIKALDSRVEVKVNNMNVSFKLTQLALPLKKHRRGSTSATTPFQTTSGVTSSSSTRAGASSRSKAVEQALASEGSSTVNRHRKGTSENNGADGSGQQQSSGVAMRTESNTVDVRGCNLMEAQEMIRDKFSAAFLATGGRPVVYILHGHGTGGVLKSKIRAWLKSERQLVKEFGPADRLDGGDALTRVDLR